MNTPADRYEQEADRVAGQVMRLPEPGGCRPLQTTPVREQSVGGDAVPSVARDVLSAPGRPLDPATRAFMEPRFGHDFGKIRVHTDARSAESAHALDARAYAAGTELVFGANQFAPDTIAGRRLLAHELAHSVQQSHSGGGIQRSPFTGIDTGSEALHERLRQDYEDEAGAPHMGGVQYTEGYAQWLQSRTARNVRFVPPTFVQVNPLERLRLGQPTGHTTQVINGQPINGATQSANQALILAQLRPSDVVHAPGLVTGQVRCRFGPRFGIETSAEVIEATAPSARGWSAKLPPAVLNNPPACAGKTDIPATLRGQPSDLAYQQLVHDSEMEHVHALEALHNRHFVPYYDFVRALSATAGTEADCEASLRQRINQRDEQAVLAFILADVAETRRFDDPLSTHRGTLTPSIAGNCASVTLTASQTNPQQPGAGPGNVQPVAPQVQAVNVANLSVSGSALMEGATLIRAFNSPADAATAMGMMVTYGITEIQRIGPLEMLLSNGRPPSGALAGISGLDIDPDAFQVTAGIPNAADWVISEVAGTQYFEIVNFGAQRDQAYAAVDLMRRHRVKRQSWIGPAASPRMMYFTV